MDELLTLLRTKLNCGISEEVIIKLKIYIESGESSLDLEEIEKCDFVNAFKSNYIIKKEFWELMDSFMDKEEIFKRIINVFYVIGAESFLR